MSVMLPLITLAALALATCSALPARRLRRQLEAERRAAAARAEEREALVRAQAAASASQALMRPPGCQNSASENRAIASTARLRRGGRAR